VEKVYYLPTFLFFIYFYFILFYFFAFFSTFGLFFSVVFGNERERRDK
jgi:hypothetical protein